MMKSSVIGSLSLGVIFVVLLAAAIALGAGQGHRTSAVAAPIDSATEHSAFVQSGGVVAEPDRSVPNAAEALTHARAPDGSEATASTF